MEPVFGQEKWKELQQKKIIVGEELMLERLRKVAKLVSETDTITNDWIRVFDLDGSIIVQEIHLKTKKILFRLLSNLEKANKFIDYRKEIIELLWERCCGGGLLLEFDKPYDEKAYE